MIFIGVRYIQLFQLRLSDPTQAYAIRPKGSVVSCKSDLSEVGRGTLNFSVQVINWHHPIIVSGNPDLAFHFQLLVLALKCKNSCSIFFMMLFFLLLIYIPCTCSTCTHIFKICIPF